MNNHVQTRTCSYLKVIYCAVCRNRVTWTSAYDYATWTATNLCHIVTQSPPSTPTPSQPVCDFALWTSKKEKTNKTYSVFDSFSENFAKNFRRNSSVSQLSGQSLSRINPTVSFFDRDLDCCSDHSEVTMEMVMENLTNERFAFGWQMRLFQKFQHLMRRVQRKLKRRINKWESISSLTKL